VSVEHANKLEHWFYSLPSLVQEVLHEPFTWMNDALRCVAGNPEALLAAGGQYVQIAEAVHQIGQQQLHDRAALAGRWGGDAYDAFTAKMQHVEAQLDKLAEGTRQVKELLESGAQACVEGANMIIDIVVSLIMMALGTIAVNVALSVISLGTTLAAGVAEVVAEALASIAQVVRVLERTARILEKLSEMFFKLEQLLKKIAEVLGEIKEVLAESKALAKASRGWDKLGAKVSFGLQKTVVSKGIWAATAGTVNIPGTAGGLYHAGQEYVHGWQDASQAQDDAQR
jgi:uncharacterized protein YukE